MSFVYPQFLWAFALLAIPILIHLFNFRRYKKILFTNVRFLKEVKEQTRKRSRLKHLIVLLTRLLAFSFLVLAFAQPYEPQDEQDIQVGGKSVSVYIDNSFSMAAMGKDGRLLDMAKEQAANVVNSFEETDRFQLMTNDLEGYRNRFVSRNEFLRMVEDLELSPAARSMDQIVSRQNDLLFESLQDFRHAFLLSDFQKSTTPLEAIKTDTGIDYHLLPFSTSIPENVYIDSLWFESPLRQVESPDELFIRIRNATDAPVENLQVLLDIDGSAKVGSIDLGPNESATTQLGFTLNRTGIHACKAVIAAGDNQLDFDDTLHFSFKVQEKIRVLELGENTAGLSPVEKVFRTDPFYEFEKVSQRQFDLSRAASFDLIVLNGAIAPGSGLISVLGEFVAGGGSLMLFPSGDIDVRTWNQMLRELEIGSITTGGVTTVGNLTLEHPFFNGVFEKTVSRMDLPGAQAGYPLNASVNSAEEVLMRSQDGKSFLSLFRKGLGRVYYSGANLGKPGDTQKTFDRHALFVPVMLRAAENSVFQPPLYLESGRKETIEVKVGEYDAEKVFTIQHPESGFEFIPPVNRNSRGSLILSLDDEDGARIPGTGVFEVLLDKKHLFSIGYNYSRKESEPECYSQATLEEWVDEQTDASVNILEGKDGSNELTIAGVGGKDDLWKICLLLCLLMLAFETLLLRVWK